MLARAAHILSTGRTKVVRKSNSAPGELMQQALEMALGRAGLNIHDLDGLVAIPSIAKPHFMEAHYQATRMGMLPHKNVRVRTIDTGGAGPVTGLLTAAQMVRHEGCNAVAVIAGDSISSLSTDEFLKRADVGCRNPDLPNYESPVIPHGYSRITEWQMNSHGTTREQLAMCAVLMSVQASSHPGALTRKPLTLEQVLEGPAVAPALTRFEVARRADGGAAVIVTSTDVMEEQQRKQRGNQQGGLLPAAGVTIVGGGEASGPLYPPAVIDDTMFSCEEAGAAAYAQSGLSVSDIDFFGLYDCFPVCLLRAVEAVRLAPPRQGGQYIERAYRHYESTGELPTSLFPVNTHGGLLAFGAPWEVPAMYNIIEAVDQLQGSAAGKQVADCRRALVYGNGGIFSHSAIAVLEREDA